MTETYKSNKMFRTQIYMLLAFSFVLEKDVQFAYELISKIFLEYIKPIGDYWESTYVGYWLQNVAPRYSIKILWYFLRNLFEKLNEDLSRTNNSLEAWHKALQNSLDSSFYNWEIRRTILKRTSSYSIICKQIQRRF